LSAVRESILKTVSHYASDLVDLETGAIVSVAGIVQSVRMHYTKASKTMAFVEIDDLEGRLELIVFPRQWDSYKNLLQEGSIIKVVGKVDAERGDPKIIAEKITSTIDLPDPEPQASPVKDAQIIDPSHISEEKDILLKKQNSPASGEMPRCLVVHIKSRGDMERDARSIRVIYGHIFACPGNDKVEMGLLSSEQVVNITFPNLFTNIGSDLINRLSSLECVDRIEIIDPEDQN
jgi:DNA polymerase III alpha subunit